MNRRPAAALAAAGIFMLAACQSAPAREVSPGADELQQQRETVLAAADWSKKIDLTIEMHDHGYRPRELRLKSGQPYRIRIFNNGGVNHYFTAPEFFHASATRKAEVPNVAEFKAPVFTSFEVYARGGALDLYVVPMRKGSYRAHCHLKDHLKLDTEAILIVE